MAAPKIICLGMNEESEKAISALVAEGADICAIAGLPAASSGNVSDYVDLSAIAHANGISWFPVVDVNSDETLAAFRATDADMLFVLGWSQLLSESAIEVFPQGVVGSHPSELPYGRGRAPVAWTVLEDRRESAVTLFRMTSGVDDGMVLKQARFDIPERPTARIVYDLAAENLASGFVELYAELAAGSAVGVPQDSGGASWRSKRVPADGWIDFRCSAEEIDKLVRAASEPYPGAYSYIGGERALFLSSEPATGDDLRRKGGTRAGSGAAAEHDPGSGRGCTPLVVRAWLAHRPAGQDTPWRSLRLSGRR